MALHSALTAGDLHFTKVKSGSGSPNTTLAAATYVGDLYVDSDTNTLYWRATNTGSNDWKGSPFSITGSGFTFAITLTGNTAVTFPTSGTLATLAGSETLTNKNLGSTTNVLTGATADTLRHSTSGNTTTFQDVVDTVVYRATTDTLTNKNLGSTTNVLTGATADTLKHSTSGNTTTFQDVVDTVVYRATTDTLTNKNLGSTTNVLTGATADTLKHSTSGNTTTFQDVVDTVVYRATTDTLTNKNLGSTTNVLTGATADTLRHSSSGNTTTFQDVVDTVVYRATTDTLTNKSISGSTNTITNVSLTTGVTGILPIANGGTNGASKTTAFNNLSPNSSKGDLVTHDGTNNTNLAVGSNGQVLSADSTQTTGLKWISTLTNPMTTLGDIIYENATPAPARLAGNTTTDFNILVQQGTGSVSAAPAWTAIPDLSTSTSGIRVEGSRGSPAQADTQNVYSGTYTPTVTGVTGVTVGTVLSSQWSRVGNVVTVSGGVGLTFNQTAGNLELTISLPITRSGNFPGSGAGAGGGLWWRTGTAVPTTSENVTLTILGNGGTNDRVDVFANTYTVDNRAGNANFMFSYTLS